MLSVVIVGGGLGGFSTAIGLALSGHRVTLLESQKQFSELGAGVQLLPNLTRILRDWSLLDQVRAKATQPEYLAFRSYRDGQFLHKHRVNPGMEQAYGFPYLNIHRYDLLQILIAKARDLQVRLETDSAVVDLDMSKPSVTTTRKETFIADVIVGADGERSFIRSVLLGCPYRPQATGRLVYRFSIDLEKLRADPVLRELVDPPTITVWLGPSRHVVAYEVPHGGVYNVALTCPDPIPGRQQFGPRKADMNEFRQMFHSWDIRFLQLLDMAKEASFWTLLQLPQENRVWTDAESGRVVLIGDAAHAMTPYLAQGAAQAIEDGAFLSHLFGNEAVPENVPAGLKFFCDRRQPRTLSVRARARKAGEKYELPDGEDQELRDHQMRDGKLCEGFPNPFADPVLSHWLYGYSVQEDAKFEHT